RMPRPVSTTGTTASSLDFFFGAGAEGSGGASGGGAAVLSTRIRRGSWACGAPPGNPGTPRIPYCWSVSGRSLSTGSRTRGIGGTDGPDTGGRGTRGGLGGGLAVTERTKSPAALNMPANGSIDSPPAGGTAGGAPRRARSPTAVVAAPTIGASGLPSPDA